MQKINTASVVPFKVRPVNHGSTKRDKNRYCGPAVLSIMSGITTGEASRLIRNLFPYVHAVRGTSTGQISQAFAALKISMDKIAYRKAQGRNPTLAGWLKQTVEERTPGRVFLIVAGNHWQIVTGRRYICGIVKELVSIKDKQVKRRARVTEVFELTPSHPDGRVRIPHDKVAQPKSTRSDHAYNRVQKLKRDNPNLGFDYEIDRWLGGDSQYWVGVSGDWEEFIYHVRDTGECESNPAFADVHDPFILDNRCCYDWSEVEECMLGLKEFATKWYPQYALWKETQ